jgi:hypothetical protein
MKKSIKKFLNFNGTNIYFLDIDGTYWIAIKPICKALNVEYTRQLKTMKNDDILRDVWALQPMHDTLNRLQEMTCLPEKFIYGWIFSIQSSSEELKKYKKECYEVLFDYFRGAIVKKQEILEDKAVKIVEKNNALEVLRQTPEYQNYIKVKGDLSEIDKISKKIDDDIVKEKLKTLFDQDFIEIQV